MEGFVDGLRRKPRAALDVIRQKLAARKQDMFGREIPDPTPVAPPIGFNRQPTMVEHIRAMVRSEELRRAAEAAGAETFDEADDFDVPDELNPVSAYEVGDDLEPPASLRAKKDAAEKAAAEEAAKPPTGAAPAPPAWPASST